jgi:hypothetical protein
MGFVTELWLPIVLSAAAVFVASAVVWMFLPHHTGDWRGVPREEALREAVRVQSLAPGQYVLPHCAKQEEWKTPEMLRKFEEGPVAYLTVLPSGRPTMGGKLIASFVLYLVISVFCAYIGHLVLEPGAAFQTVFRVLGPIAWLAYGAGHLQSAIWFGKPRSVALKDVLDGLLYGLITAAIFAALWPGA